MPIFSSRVHAGLEKALAVLDPVGRLLAVGMGRRTDDGLAALLGIAFEQKALEHRVDFASVELQLTEEYKAQLNPPAPSVSTRIHNAFVAGYQKEIPWTESMLVDSLFLSYLLGGTMKWVRTKHGERVPPLRQTATFEITHTENPQRVAGILYRDFPLADRRRRRQP